MSVVTVVTVVKSDLKSIIWLLKPTRNLPNVLCDSSYSFDISDRSGINYTSDSINTSDSIKTSDSRDSSDKKKETKIKNRQKSRMR